MKKFKVGDRVRAISNVANCSAVIGMLGTIIFVSNSEVCIEFDNPFDEGHNGDGLGRDNCCRFTGNVNSLEKLPYKKISGHIKHIFSSKVFKLNSEDIEIYCKINKKYTVCLGNYYTIEGHDYKESFVVKKIRKIRGGVCGKT